MTHKVTEETRKLVESASGMGLAHDTISILIGVTGKTLRKRYRKELDGGRAKAHFNVAKTVYEKAVSGDRTMAIWYTKTQMGWRETVQVATPPGESVELGVAGEPELIGAYYERLARIAAERRGHSGSHPRVGAPGPAPEGPERGEEAGEG